MLNKVVRKFKLFQPQMGFSIVMLWDNLPITSFLPYAMLKSKALNIYNLMKP